MVIIKALKNGFAVACNDKLNLSTALSSETINVPAPILPENLTVGQINVLNKETRTITSIAFSRNEDFVALATENKQIVVLDKDYKVVKNFIVNRAASKVVFTLTNDIVVADKTGDVYLYHFKEDKEPTLLLGHLSVILDVLLTDCEKYIITCDRDEKVRVSKFPNAYNIVSFCLGHKEFVTTLRLYKNSLLSASGDGTVRIWNYQNGQMLGLLDSNQYIQDRTLVTSFSKEMEDEKVDIEALPIIDMQIHQGEQTFLILSVLKLKGLQLYSIDFSTNNFVYLGNILETQNIKSFCSSAGLVVLSQKLLYFDVIDGKPIEKTNNYIEKLNKLLDVVDFDSTNFITSLYKRKFDNVQEYLERKKQRLEAK